MPTNTQLTSEDLANLYNLYSTGWDIASFSATRADLCRHLGITKTVFSRFSLAGYSYTDDRGETWYQPLNVVKYIHNTLAKRGQTLAEYAEYVVKQNRAASLANHRRKKLAASSHSPATDQPNPTLANQILAVIHQITKDHPKARGVFERELQKIGVSLPKINPPVE
jgi:hypothetical protein